MNDKFIKLMMMTTSANDAEALVAIRKANAVLKQHNLTWNDVILCETFTVPKNKSCEETAQEFEDFAATNKGNRNTDSVRIEALFRVIFKRENVDEKFRSIHLWWLAKGFLTDRQYQSIIKEANRG